MNYKGEEFQNIKNQRVNEISLINILIK